MRYGIVSDIHSNLEALSAVMTELDGVDAVICPGDVVGYGADPNACCDIIREKSQLTVIGNHDAAAVDRLDLAWFNPAARTAAIWTKNQLSAENRLFLQGLSPIERCPEFMLAHATPSDPMSFVYITTPWEARPAFAEMEGIDLCFIAHTHAAECYIIQEGSMSPLHLAMTGGGIIELKEDRKYLVNCGSVGQPRDGNPRAAFCIFDSEARIVEIKRIEYDIDTAQRKILDAGLPPMLAKRLELGR